MIKSALMKVPAEEWAHKWIPNIMDQRRFIAKCNEDGYTEFDAETFYNLIDKYGFKSDGMSGYEYSSKRLESSRKPIKSSKYYIEYYTGGTDNGYVRYDNRPTIDLDNAMIFDSEQEANEWIDDHSNEWKATLKVVPYPDYDEIESSRKPIKSGWERTDMASGPIWDNDKYRIIEKNDFDSEDKFYILRDKSNQRAKDIRFDTLAEAMDYVDFRANLNSSRQIKSAKNFASVVPYTISFDNGKIAKKGTSFIVDYDKNESGDYVLGISVDGVGKTQLRFDSEDDAKQNGWIIESSRKPIKSGTNNFGFNSEVFGYDFPLVGFVVEDEEENDPEGTMTQEVVEQAKELAEQMNVGLYDDYREPSLSGEPFLIDFEPGYYEGVCIKVKEGQAEVYDEEKEDYVPMSDAEMNTYAGKINGYFRTLREQYGWDNFVTDGAGSHRVSSSRKITSSRRPIKSGWVFISSIGDASIFEENDKYLVKLEKGANIVEEYFDDEESARDFAKEITSSFIKSARYIATDPESGEVLGSADTYDEAINEWGEDVIITDSKVGDRQEDTGLFSSLNKNDKQFIEGLITDSSIEDPDEEIENYTYECEELGELPEGTSREEFFDELINYFNELDSEVAEGQEEGGLFSSNKTVVRQGPNFKTLDETPAEHIMKNLDTYKGYTQYDMEELVLEPSGYTLYDSDNRNAVYKKDGAEDITLLFRNGELKDAKITSSRKPIKSSIYISDIIDDISDDCFEKIRQQIFRKYPNIDDDELTEKIDEYLEGWRYDSDSEVNNKKQAKQMVVDSWEDYIDLSDFDNSDSAVSTSSLDKLDIRAINFYAGEILKDVKNGKFPATMDGVREWVNLFNQREGVYFNPLYIKPIFEKLKRLLSPHVKALTEQEE